MEKYRSINFFKTMVLVFCPITVFAQTQDDTLSARDLKKLSLEELMNIEVTSVSKHPEKLTEAAASIQVITNEEIRRSGATTLPDALRLVSNLMVAQSNAYSWAISARGFNTGLANKLLVMIDGRVVYSPLFAGVFWDVQSVLLEDVDRIEVISGPGGTLWGANAVNGIINVITKSAADTKGIYATAAGGTYLQDHAALRFGGKIGENFSYRVYAQHQDLGPTMLPGTALDPERKVNKDVWGLSQTGFRMDWTSGEKDRFSVLGNFYMGKEQTALDSTISIDGQNVLGRWTHTFSEKSNMAIQMYADRTWRHDKGFTTSDEVYTYDFDFQHRFMLGKRQNVLWGLGYRMIQNTFLPRNNPAGILPASRDMPLYSAFVQDEIMIVPEKLKFIIGSKFLHNVYTGFEVQPSVRLAFTPTEHHTVWAACTRAVRTPSRIDVDYFSPLFEVPPTVPQVNGGPDFVSEKLIAYELGYRVQPATGLLVSLAGYYNSYDDLASLETLPGTPIFQFMNGVEGYSYGGELALNYQLLKSWRIRGGYTYIHQNLTTKPNHVFDPKTLFGEDPAHMFVLQSLLNLPGNLTLDLNARYIDKRPYPVLPAFFTFDARLAWTWKKIEISVTGQNLWEYLHSEYTGALIPRGVYGRISCRF